MAERAKWLYLAAGLVIGGAVVFVCDRFPGGQPAAARAQFAYDAGRTYRVERVVDGDTIVLEGGLHLRYAGVDSPEIGHFDYKNPEPFSREASEANKRLVDGRQVRLTFGPQKLDRFGRLLAAVEVLDDRSGRWLDVSEELLRQGLARRLHGMGAPPDETRLIRAEEEAKAAGAGLWGKSPPARGGAAP